MLNMAKRPRKLVYPLLNESAAYPAIPTGPEIFLKEASPITNFEMKLIVKIEKS